MAANFYLGWHRFIPNITIDEWIDLHMELGWEPEPLEDMQQVPSQSHLEQAELPVPEPDIIVISDVDSSQYTIPEVVEPEPELHIDLDLEDEDDKSTQEYGEDPEEGTCTCHNITS